MAARGTLAATAAVAPMLRKFRLANRFMAVTSLPSLMAAPAGRTEGRCFGSTLRRQYSVRPCRLDVPKRHHGVIFVHHVVTVNRIFPGPVAELEEEPHPLVGMQLSDVLARILDRERWRLPVARQDLVLFEVDVDRMGPIPAEVHQDPLLHAVLLHREPERVAIHELAVDGPLAIQAVELEGPDRRGVEVGAWERVKLLLRRRQTVVDGGSAGHAELQQQIAAAGGQD